MQQGCQCVLNYGKVYNIYDNTKLWWFVQVSLNILFIFCASVVHKTH